MSWISYLEVTIFFALAVSVSVSADSLEDIKHVVLFMQENRAFDHVSLRFSWL